jgi:hypothetical protein
MGRIQPAQPSSESRLDDMPFPQEDSAEAPSAVAKEAISIYLYHFLNKRT